MTSYMHVIVYDCICMGFDVNVCRISGRNSFNGEECKTREKSYFSRKGKMVILVEKS